MTRSGFQSFQRAVSSRDHSREDVGWKGAFNFILTGRWQQYIF
jgi:hypothetical protein